jgi:hypothetical protein
VEWVYHMLQAFNTGNLALYQELCRVHNAALSAQPALVQNEQKLLEKINILCLMEIIFRYYFWSSSFEYHLHFPFCLLLMLCVMWHSVAVHQKIELSH